MSSPQVAAIAAVGVATAVFLLRRLLQVKPFIPSLKMSVHLHRVFFGAGELFNSVEGLGRITFDEADDNGMCQFYVMGARCISVLKAEHIRTVVLASNFRQRVPLFDEYVDAIVGTRPLPSAAAHNEDASGGVTPQSFADNLLTFLFAGYDTTSIALAYTLHLLAAHPQVQDKVVAEIQAVLGADTAPTCDTVSRLTFCAAVVTESVRLFPPSSSPCGHSKLTCTWAGTTSPKGNWGADAAAFRPERHLDEIHGKDKAFRMMAFSAGPRNCVGMRFAMMEAVIVLAVVLRRCRFSLPTDAPPVRPVVAGLVQKPEHGIWLHVQPRESAPAL
ncbi:hypothetical protein DYB36_008553 [Aphanomyces astaci]|uniref:Cytochrome P450 n=1 Tax=Aphanomyces astaci TaxID=112090 RepID=A0A397AUZ6_APHAT|nr:hypothetical protein DYB36_008553 [Aphanomyces astaci]